VLSSERPSGILPSLLEYYQRACELPLFGAVPASVPARHKRVDGSLSPQSPARWAQLEAMDLHFMTAARWLVLAA
jgi:hypothetical protein